MSLAAKAIEKRTVSYFAVFLMTVGGIAAFFQLGQLEDPTFTVKTAMVSATYPGASAAEVEQEVTDRLEEAILEMAQIKSLQSLSRAGLSMVKVEIKDEYWSDRLPQVWDELRRKVGDVEASLPPGVGTPVVGDDFGDVYGFVYALTGDGFTYAELEDTAKEMKRRLNLVPGVARVELWGVQPKCIYLDVSQAQLAELGLVPADILATLEQQNTVVDSGGIDVGGERLRFVTTGAFARPEDIGALTIRSRLSRSDRGGNELIELRDIAAISRGYLSPNRPMMRLDGEPALGISLAALGGSNVVAVGEGIQAEMSAILADLPVGIEATPMALQSEVVDESIVSFSVNLVEAVAIVFLVLALSMGIRMGVIIGVGGLLLTIVGSFMIMGIWGIDLQRMSLGALVIAMGMMVDNAIVVADGIVVRLKRGMDRKQAAIEAASLPSMPLLGATIVAVMAFYPIFASPASAGEYCRTLFQVVGISLMLSWVLSVTVTPLMCIALLPDPKPDEPGAAPKDEYGGLIFRLFGRFLAFSIRFRWGFVGAMLGLLVVSVLAFRFVPKMFFPDSSMAKIMVDYWAPEGTSILQTAADVRAIEKQLEGDERVAHVNAFIGAGPPRFYLPVEPEKPFSCFAQLIINLGTRHDVDPLIAELEEWTREAVPQAMVRVRKFGVGPADVWKIEARFTGPADAEATTLRRLADEGMAILEASPIAKEVRSDWRDRTKSIVNEYSQQRGRWTGISRGDVGRATKRAFDGVPVGIFREGDDLLPIVVRHVAEERGDLSSLETMQVASRLSPDTVPLAQVAESPEVKWEDPLIWRWNRRRAISVQCTPDGATAATLRGNVLADFEKIELPPGYALEWDGEYDSSKQAQEGLQPGVAPAIVIILFIIVALFNALRPPLIIILAIPFAMIGMTAGLLALQAPFGFLALLGAMSLAGMMIKNSIVLLDQVNIERAEGKEPYRAVIDAAVSRLRPVMLAAATTILGVIPLLQDVFWYAMAVTIMFGLLFGTVLTMVLVPVLYAIMFRIPSPSRKG